MVAGQHKLSRRALLAGACAAPVAALPPPRHCEERSDAAIQGGHFNGSEAGLLRCARNDEGWKRALSAFALAEAALDALAHTEDDALYDGALERHGAALAGVMGRAAPDLAAVARKLELFARHSLFESDYGESALATLRRDVERLAAVAP